MLLPDTRIGMSLPGSGRAARRRARGRGALRARPAELHERVLTGVGRVPPAPGLLRRCRVATQDAHVPTLGPDARREAGRRLLGDEGGQFISDGRLKTTLDGTSREVRWELKVQRLNGKDIDVGELKIIGDEEREFAQSIGQSGDLTYAIETSANSNTMSLRVDATKVSPYKKNILI